MLSLARILVGVLALASIACGHVDCDECRACKDYLVCLTRIGMPGVAELDATYGPMGTCWTTTQDATDKCITECTDGLKAVKAGNPDAGC